MGLKSNTMFQSIWCSDLIFFFSIFFYLVFSFRSHNASLDVNLKKIKSKSSSFFSWCCFFCGFDNFTRYSVSSIWFLMQFFYFFCFVHREYVEINVSVYTLLHWYSKKWNGSCKRRKKHTNRTTLTFNHKTTLKSSKHITTMHSNAYKNKFSLQTRVLFSKLKFYHTLLICFMFCFTQFHVDILTILFLLYSYAWTRICFDFKYDVLLDD